MDFANDNPACEVICIHHEIVTETKDKVISVAMANNLAELFKTLADPTRVRIIDALFQNEFCVCDLATLLDLSQSATSHQLRLLRNNHLVKYRREGKQVYYSLDDDHVAGLYKQGIEHLMEDK